MKTPAPVAVPPAVVIPIFPVLAPVGTVAVTCVSEFMVKLVAATPPNVTFLVSDNQGRRNGIKANSPSLLVDTKPIKLLAIDEWMDTA